jgi:isoquinoline 1-oxidoreductase beta subunit
MSDLGEDTSATATPARRRVSRRWIIAGGVALGGGALITVGLSPFSRLPEQRRMIGREGETVVVSALRIASDGGLTVIYPHADMGTGNGTALAQILAEELDADWEQVRIERAPAELAFANGALGQAFIRGETEIPAFLAGPAWLLTRRLAEVMRLQITGGSTAIALTGMEGMRHAGASARYMLIRAAAKAWGAPVSEVGIEKGRLTHRSGRSMGFGDVAEASLAFTPPARLPFKSASDYRIMGRSVSRLDIPAKVDGGAIYSGDVRLPGMVFAAIRACPTPGGQLARVDETPARSRRGVVDVISMPTAVAVTADSFWRAQKAVEALDPVWSPGANAAMSSAGILEAMRASLEEGGLNADYSVGDAEKVLESQAERVIERVYTAPFLAHAAMETVGCVAWFNEGRLEVWGAFQDGLNAKYQAAGFAGIDPELVTIHHTEMGGAFGRRAGALDYLEHAVAVAARTKGPVNLIYSREEDMTHDFYRNASVARMRAVLDGSGRPLAIVHDYAERQDPPDASRFPYAVANLRARYSKGNNPAPWGAWRSVDHSIHGFFIESFIDELAAEAKIDPYDYRRDLLRHDPRSTAVLDAVAEMSGWRQAQAGGGRALGMALKASFGTIVAQVAEVETDASGRLRVPRFWIAADPGFAVNPDGFTQQMEGGVVYGLTAALFGEIAFEAGAVVQTNFWDYPMVRMADCPSIVTRIINSGAKVGGAGEPATPPVAAAVSNALFRATGQRVRALPLSKGFQPGTV